MVAPSVEPPPLGEGMARQTEGSAVIVQVIRASIKPDRRTRWLEVIQQNAVKTRVEHGCERYQVAEDLEAPNNFVIVEEWTDLDAVYVHFRNQFKWLMNALGDVFAAPPDASIHEVASTMTLEEVLAGAGIS